jgi:hypothetical protein
MNVAALKQHAEKFGSDGVVETAVECGYTVGMVADLIEFCDKADYALAKKKNGYARARKHRLSFEQRAERALGIPTEEEGEK